MFQNEQTFIVVTFGACVCISAYADLYNLRPLIFQASVHNISSELKTTPVTKVLFEHFRKPKVLRKSILGKIHIVVK